MRRQVSAGLMPPVDVGRMQTFATVLGLMLVSLARIVLAPDVSARAMMRNLEEIKATLVCTTTDNPGRRPTVMLAPELTA